MLCRYLKPTFMRWTRSSIEILFGQKVFTAWVTKCNNVGLELAAVVGRPLYVCTRMKQNGKMRGMLAAMSPLMEQREKHKLSLAAKLLSGGRCARLCQCLGWCASTRTSASKTSLCR